MDMAKREWMGKYEFHYEVYYTYKQEWVKCRTNLGECLNVNDAVAKAVAFMNRCGEIVKPLYLMDGWGNKFMA